MVDDGMDEGRRRKMKDLNGRDPLEDQTFDETQNAPSRTKV
jgi:hypothetical protein